MTLKPEQIKTLVGIHRDGEVLDGGTCPDGGMDINYFSVDPVTKEMEDGIEKAFDLLFEEITKKSN